MSYTDPNTVDILGNIEILPKMRPGKMSRMVTLLQYSNTYHIIAEDILNIAHPRSDLSGKRKYPQLCAHFFAHEQRCF